MENDNKEEDSIFKSKHYFDLKEAADDVSMAFGTKENLEAGAKIVGKGLFNAGLFAGKLAKKIAEELPGAIANQAQRTLNDREDLTPDQRSKLEDIVAKGKKS